MLSWSDLHKHTYNEAKKLNLSFKLRIKQVDLSLQFFCFELDGQQEIAYITCKVFIFEVLKKQRLEIITE